MVFSSHLFVFYFLPVALLVYYAVPRRGKHLGLTLLSYLFYGWANPWFIFLMFFSTAVDFGCGLAMTRGATGGRLEPNTERNRGQRTALILSVLVNLSLLGFFKYFNFGIDSYNALLGAMGLEAYQYHNLLRITLPLGISFYTFQSMSYTIDIYRGEVAAARSFTDFACYVSMFPQLVAGPIIRFREAAGQLRERTHSSEKFARGAAFFCLGMSKKVLIADTCGTVADAAFGAGALTAPDAWYGVTAYAFQIYFDFSAYSDMAIGLSLMLGFVFPKNFDAPYRAGSITEFWQRWHISLSTWFRDYLYIPLGGNRKRAGRTFANVMTVMLLGGLWHGAGWTFVVWGALHGAMLVVERLLGKQSPYRRLPNPLRIAVTFLILLITWVFFRAETSGEALQYLGFMFGCGAGPQADLVGGLIYQPFYAGGVILAAVITWATPQTWDWTRRITPPRAALCLGLFLVSLGLLIVKSYSPFIYFIF